ncbi:MAG TPA: nitrilase-related carbon-nitrogen hydrolase [Rhizomicrobium sp.]|nr:nitrilase-related carbon-nitrogen hydrolase [Rhizomicrobium sp.]
MIALLCALLSGAMFYLSQGLDDVWWLAWLAPVPLLWLAYGEARPWHVFAASVGAFACGQIYMMQAYLGILPPLGLFLMMFGMGSLFAATVRFAQRCRRKLPPLAVLVAFPAAWTAAEFIVSLISPHGSWGALGYSQVSFPPVLQIASLFGLYAITFTLCLFANALALTARGAWKAAIPGLAACALALVFGLIHLGQPQGVTMRVTMLSDRDGWLKTIRKLDFAASRAMSERYAAAAREETKKGARFIVIPETAVAADPAWRDQALAPLAAVARESKATIVTGVVLVKPWRNAAFSFLPDGSQRSYDKRHLLPPGEDKFKPGPGPGLLGHEQAIAICKDLDFPRTLRADALNADGAGIRLMAVPANDFVKDDWIHARMAVMRGVENGFVVVRSAFNGLETASDARGHVLARASTMQAGMVRLSADVPLGPGPTQYTRMGDVFAWACVALTLGLAALLLRKPRAQV